MKCTLRKVDGGIVATIDERPKVKDWYVIKSLKNNFLYSQVAFLPRDGFYKDCHKIIASTIPNVGKELKWERGKLLQHISNLHERFLEEHIGKEYDYAETENLITIQL